MKIFKRSSFFISICFIFSINGYRFLEQNSMEPIDQESISQEENKIKKKFLHDFNKNFTQNQVSHILKKIFKGFQL